MPGEFPVLVEHTRQAMYDVCEKAKVILRTLLPGNPVLLLDEPTLGVDPWTTGDIHRQLKGLGKEGKTILCTTNNISEAKALGDRVLTLDKGELNEWKPVLAGLS